MLITISERADLCCLCGHRHRRSRPGEACGGPRVVRVFLSVRLATVGLLATMLLVYSLFMTFFLFFINLFSTVINR